MMIVNNSYTPCSRKFVWFLRCNFSKIGLIHLELQAFKGLHLTLKLIFAWNQPTIPAVGFMILEHRHPYLSYINVIGTSKVPFSFIQCWIYVWANRAIAQGPESFWGGGLEQRQDVQRVTLLHWWSYCKIPGKTIIQCHLQKPLLQDNEYWSWIPPSVGQSITGASQMVP